MDRATCNGYQLVTLATARYRQLAWEHAELLADLGELAHTPGGAHDAAPARQPAVNRAVFREVGFALTMAAGTAEDLTKLGVTLRDELPVVGQALAAGRIDLAKAKMMVRELALAGLDNDLAHAVAARVLR